MRCFAIPVALLVVLASGCGSFEPSAPTSPRSTGITSLSQSTDCDVGHAFDLVTSGDIQAGRAICRAEGDILYLHFVCNSDYELAATEVAVVGDPGDFPVDRSGLPRVNAFPSQMKHRPRVDDYVQAIDLAALGLASTDVIYVAAHARVKRTNSPKAAESAWCAGVPFAFLDLPELPGFMEYVDGVFVEHPAPANPKQSAMYFTENLLALRGMLLWNKLGSAAEIGNSELGPDGTIVGDLDYVPLMFGNGMKPQPRTGDHNIPDNCVDFHDLCLDDQGTIEFWYLPLWETPSIGNVVNMLDFGVEDSVDDLFINMGFNDWQNLAGVSIWQPNRDYVGVYFVPSQIPDWEPGVPIHLAFSWDGTNPDVNQKVKLYFNGVDALSLGATVRSRGNPTWETVSPDGFLRVGIRTLSGDWDRHHWEGHQQAFDNIKVWNYVKTDFTDRFLE